ncbi:MAG: hypothetical protein LBT40_05375, partial [Deltaproteobacteria bacterium]|nr:hypothetical protein [Deltaproteobacteria bacterium]
MADGFVNQFDSVQPVKTDGFSNPHDLLIASKQAACSWGIAIRQPVVAVLRLDLSGISVGICSQSKAGQTTAVSVRCEARGFRLLRAGVLDGLRPEKAGGQKGLQAALDTGRAGCLG